MPYIQPCRAEDMIICFLVHKDEQMIASPVNLLSS